MKKFIPYIIGASIILLVAFGYSLKQNSTGWFSPQILQDTIPSKPPVLKYGLPADSFFLQTGKVKRRESLGKILDKLGVSGRDVHTIAQKSKTIFNVRKIRRGNNWVAFFSKDSLVQLDYFVYEIDPVNYVTYQFKDSLAVSRGEKEVQKVLKTVSGEINSSLWNAMVDNDINPLLANELSEIYAWTIDFFGIQKGDKFRVIYEERYIDSTSIGIGKIYAANFFHFNSNYWAFTFVQDGKEGYFDEEGKSLKKAFLKAPLKYSRISSRFSHSRMHPILKIRRPHLGIDYAAPSGTPVLSIGDGTVIKKAYQKKGGGRYVKIKHNSVYTTTYMHLRGYAKSIRQGARVKQGQVIGYVGMSGLASGPHLDFRIHKNGHAIDPLKVNAPPVEPVKPAFMDSFIIVKDSLKKELENIGVTHNDTIINEQLKMSDEQLVH